LQGESFWTIGDSVAIGCVLAMVRPRLDANARWLAFHRSRWFVLVPLTALASYLVGARYTLPSLALLQTITIACIAACVDHAIRHPDDLVGRVLNWTPVVAIGTLSYSLYLWQQPFLNRHTSGLYTMFPVNVVLAFAAATLSYHLIEQPMLRWRERIEARLEPRAAREAVVLEKRPHDLAHRSV
jgi:peptidoglycan/LPS O-acetylase OafA/YrhL